jgi:hypothetical protein
MGTKAPRSPAIGRRQPAWCALLEVVGLEGKASMFEFLTDLFDRWRSWKQWGERMSWKGQRWASADTATEMRGDEMKNARRLLLPLAITIWLIVILTGFWGLHAYNNAPGRTGPAPGHVPDELLDQPTTGCYRLLLFAHPRCPCTRATLDELAVLLEINRVAVAAEVWFIRPKGMPMGWEQTPLWQAAAAIPGVSVHCDEEGVLARRLGAETSGQVVLYDPDGQLLFSGGITRARGQEGESAGRRAILSLLSGKAALPETPIFGCPLFAPGECCGKEEGSCHP